MSHHCWHGGVVFDIAGPALQPDPASARQTDPISNEFVANHGPDLYLQQPEQLPLVAIPNKQG
jgi:hypothetical protein